MTRPHEDLRHHTPVDHRSGGPAIDFAAGAWCAVDVAHVRADRIDAGLAAGETLIEQARRSNAKAQTAAVFRSHDDRRAIAIVEVNGHDGFGHLKASAQSQSATLALFQVSTVEGHTEIDPASHESYGFEQVAQPPNDVKSAQGFRGVVLFAPDDGAQPIAIYRFEQPSQLQAARPNAIRVYPVKTFPRT